MNFKSASVSPLEMVVLIYNVTTCTDAENDADLTVNELLRYLDDTQGGINKQCLESALYCCNMNKEDGKFWHPYGIAFDKFVSRILGKGFKFNTYYNYIEEDDGTNQTGTDGLGSDPQSNG